MLLFFCMALSFQSLKKEKIPSENIFRAERLPIRQNL